MTMGLKSLLNHAVDPVLRGMGFHRKRLVWNRRRMGLVDVVEFQTSQAGTVGHEHFTVNAGVFLPEFFRLVWKREAPSFVKEVDCVVRARIGELLMPGPPSKALDKWWHLTSDEAQLNAERELTAAMTMGVLPFLESVRSERDVRGSLEAHDGWLGRYPLQRIYLAIAKHKVGDFAGARSELTGIGGTWSERAETVERALFPESAH